MTASRERVFITGAGGFLGSHICRHFWEKGSYVIGAGRFHFSAHERHPLRFVHEFHGLTLPDPSLPELLRLTHPDLLVHCAGSSSVGPSLGQPHIDFQKNVEVCASLLESIRQESPKTTFVLLSSAAVYGNPEQLPVTETAELHPFHRTVITSACVNPSRSNTSHSMACAPQYCEFFPLMEMD